MNKITLSKTMGHQWKFKMKFKGQELNFVLDQFHSSFISDLVGNDVMDMGFILDSYTTDEFTPKGKETKPGILRMRRINEKVWRLEVVDAEGYIGYVDIDPIGVKFLESKFAYGKDRSVVLECFESSFLAPPIPNLSATFLDTPIPKAKPSKTAEKPPLGMVPRFVHESNRKTDIIQAMIKYNEQNRAYPQAWVDELNDLNKRQADQEDGV